MCYDQPVSSHGAVVNLDLRGVKCPLNWARAKVRLERMERGQILEIVVDDPRGVRDIPRAAEADGYSVIETRAIEGASLIRIEK
jgi:tRNA 2-thiouridine synthesizing protein A